jgi:hypothetical protein
MKTTLAQQAAAAARVKNYDNAAALYWRAAVEADFSGENSKSKRMYAKYDHFERMAK